MKTFKLINPLIYFDKYNNSCKANDIYEAVDTLYNDYTNFFIKPYTPISYITISDNKNKLYHFEV